MNLLGCLDRPTAGRYLLDGQEISAPRQRRAGRHPQPDHRLRLPELQPALAHQRPGERRAAAALRRRPAPPSATSGPARRWSGSGLGDRARPPPQPDVGRPAAARGHRPRPGQPAARPPGRRADRQPRLAAPAWRSWRSSRSWGASGITVHPGDPRAGHRRLRRPGHHHARRAGPAPTSGRRRSAARAATASADGGHAVNWLMTLRVALRALARNKLRSLPHRPRHGHRRGGGHRHGGHRRRGQGAGGGHLRLHRLQHAHHHERLLAAAAAPSAAPARMPTLTWDDLKAIQDRAPLGRATPRRCSAPRPRSCRRTRTGAPPSRAPRRSSSRSAPGR